MSTTSSAGRLALLAWLSLVLPATAVEWPQFEGAAHGFPVLRSANGAWIADGDFAQWIENGRLHVRILYIGQGRRIEEKAVFRQRPELIQDEWSLRELRDGKLYRQFEVDLRSGRATAKKQEEGEEELEQWSEQLDVEAGRTFAGFGFTLAIKGLRKRLIDGERVELHAIGFTPEPRLASVEIAYGGLDRMRMAGRTIRGDRFVIHPKLPWIVDLFVDIPDTRIWLTNPPPAGFLRWEGPLAEPRDAVIRVDLLPGGQSGPATPVGTSGRRPMTRSGE